MSYYCNPIRVGRELRVPLTESRLSQQRSKRRCVKTEILLFLCVYVSVLDIRAGLVEDRCTKRTAGRLAARNVYE